MTKEEQLDYLAGFFDADGSVSMHGCKSTPHVIRFSVWQSEPAVPALFRDVFGGSVLSIAARNKERHRNQWMWEKSCSRDDIFSREMCGRLISKSRQMELAIKLSLSRKSRRGGGWNKVGISETEAGLCRITPADVAYRESIATELKEANHGKYDAEERKIQERSLAYWAGLFDGDGAVSIIKDYGSRVFRPTVSIYSTYSPVLESAMARFGGRIDRNYRGGRCKSWTSSHLSACAFLRQVEPFLIEKKERVECSIALVDLIASGEKKPTSTERNTVMMFTDSVIGKMGIIVSRIQDLNRKGPTRGMSLAGAS